MTSIRADRPIVTLVNIFTVDPANQQSLVELLIAATEQTMRRQPGFISANIHKSLDGRHVTNYAQWENEDAFRSMLRSEEAGAHMRRGLEMAKVEGYLYDVVSTHERQADLSHA